VFYFQNRNYWIALVTMGILDAVEDTWPIHSSMLLTKKFIKVKIILILAKIKNVRGQQGKLGTYPTMLKIKDAILWSMLSLRVLFLLLLTHLLLDRINRASLINAIIQRTTHLWWLELLIIIGNWSKHLAQAGEKEASSESLVEISVEFAIHHPIR